MSDAMRIRARMKDGVTELLLLVPHPMETGLRKGPSGDFVPAHYITNLHVSVDSRTVVDARMSSAVAQDPLMAFHLRGVRVGDRVVVAWSDNHGVGRTDEALVV